MKKIIVIIFVIITGFSSNIYGQKDWSAKLHKVIVTESDGKYFIDDFILISTKKSSRQIKMTATAPIDVIGRDNFISFYSTYGTMLILTMMEKSGHTMRDLKIKTLDELIGQPDITINFEVAKNGFQIQLITNKGTKRKTTTWDKIFDND